MRQRDLAIRLGCNQSYISQLESGERRFTSDVVSRLESEFGDITAYITDPPEKPQVVQNNENGDNIHGDHIVVGDDKHGKDDEIRRLTDLLEAARNEIEWLRGMVEKLSMK